MESLAARRRPQLKISAGIVKRTFVEDVEPMTACPVVEPVAPAKLPARGEDTFESDDEEFLAQRKKQSLDLKAALNKSIEWWS